MSVKLTHNFLHIFVFESLLHFYYLLVTFRIECGDVKVVILQTQYLGHKMYSMQKPALLLFTFFFCLLLFTFRCKLEKKSSFFLLAITIFWLLIQSNLHIIKMFSYLMWFHFDSILTDLSAVHNPKWVHSAYGFGFCRFF